MANGVLPLRAHPRIQFAGVPAPPHSPPRTRINYSNSTMAGPAPTTHGALGTNRCNISVTIASTLTLPRHRLGGLLALAQDDVGERDAEDGEDIQAEQQAKEDQRRAQKLAERRAAAEANGLQA